MNIPRKESHRRLADVVSIDSVAVSLMFSDILLLHLGAEEKFVQLSRKEIEEAIFFGASSPIVNQRRLLKSSSGKTRFVISRRGTESKLGH